MSILSKERGTLFLMLSLILLMVLTAFLEHSSIGRVALLVAVYAILIFAILELHDKGTVRWLATGAAIPIIFIELAALLRPSHSLSIVGYALFAAFFGFVGAGHFSFLGKPGAITSGRIYASVSLYLILGMFWYALFNLMEAIHPGSFVFSGAGISEPVSRHALLYFSLATLTTLGYGDIIPVTPPARMFAALESIMGVLYIAVTVARLVAAYKRTDDKRIVGADSSEA